MSNPELECDNLALVRRGFEAFGAADMATLTELFDANCVWHAQPSGILVGEYRGRDAIFGMFAQLHRETAGTFRSIPTTMAASGDKVFVQPEVAGERHGASLHIGEVLVFTIAQGRVREVNVYLADHAENAAFWA
jgi:hypothetical protein